MKLACITDSFCHYILLFNLCNDKLINLLGFLKVGLQNLGFCYKLYVQANSVFFIKYNWTILNALENASCGYFVHVSYRLFFFILFFVL